MDGKREGKERGVAGRGRDGEEGMREEKGAKGWGEEEEEKVEGGEVEYTYITASCAALRADVALTFSSTVSRRTGSFELLHSP